MTRYDAFGLHWSDKPRERRVKGSTTYRPRTLPSVPDTGWVVPRELPNLSAAKVISIDLETCDPNLKSSGPGDLRKDGYIAGIAVGTPDGARWYFPIRHENGKELNMDPETVLAWARDAFSNPHQAKIGANIMYDVQWLAAEGVPVAGALYDVQFAQALIDENALKYDLDTLSLKYLEEHKVDEALYKWLALAYGGKPNRADQGGRIHLAPPQLAGPYAEGDVDLPLRIWEKQKRVLEDQDLMELFRMECGLMPMLMAMRRQGVKVDADGADEAMDAVNKLQDKYQQKLNAVAGHRVDVWAAPSIARAYDRLGIEYPKTPKGAPSFRKEWLTTQDDPISQLVADVRRYSKSNSTFIEGYVVNKNLNGRLHASIHPLKRVSDDGKTNGTVSGRFSYSDPNLQNIPSRDKEMSTIIRGLFIPDAPGWRRYDYSQIEYRKLAHYAIGEGAQGIRDKYKDDPRTDYHETVRMLIKDVTGILLDRKPTKNVNFGLAYGMGKATLVKNLGLTTEQGDALFDAYHTGVPFVKTTFDRVASIAAERGWIRTVLNRRTRFEMWEAADFALSKKLGSHHDPKVMAQRVDDEIQRIMNLPIEERGSTPRRGVKRARTHKALNALLQGGAADMMKMAMYQLWNSGVLDVVGVPLVTVHDELDFNDPLTKESEEAFKEVQHIMETAITLNVPVIADCEKGTTWGNCA